MKKYYVHLRNWDGDAICCVRVDKAEFEKGRAKALEQGYVIEIDDRSADMVFLSVRDKFKDGGQS